MKKLKVLFVHGGILAKAGTESYMMSVLNNVDPDKVQIDFMVFGVEEGYYDKELLERGINIYKLKYRPQDFFKGAESLRSIKARIKAEQYDIAHVHMNAFNAPMIALCKQWGIKHTVAHSHTNMFMSQNPFVVMMKKQLKKHTPNMADLLVACSQDAGKFQYGDHPFHVVNNGIDIEVFKYDPKVRHEIRRELGLEDRFILGNIGRFNFQKNHDFLLDIFAAYKKLDSSAALVLIGEGELKDKIIKKAKQLGILDDIYFLGIKEHTAPYYQAMDAFVLPSLFEGLGIVLVEAQTSGLECYASVAVPREASMGEHCMFLELTDPQQWADAIYERKNIERVSRTQDVYDKKYDAYGSAQNLISLYESIL